MDFLNDFFMPRDWSIDEATPYWLLAMLVPLAVVGIALLVQVVMLWRRGARAGVAWWGQVPLVLPVLWAAVCGLVASEVFGLYRDVTTSFSCPPGEICSLKGVRFVMPFLMREGQFALLAAAIMLGVGWLALARFTRRINRA